MLAEKKRDLTSNTQKKKEEMMEQFQKAMKKKGGKIDVIKIYNIIERYIL